MIEALSMGEYGFFVWSAFIISMFVLLINYICAHREFISELNKVKLNK
jgi:heme exporter protein CcmD|tara:strand:+ start:252 stop:395 length:144 start_codon:yes stop_codon:yes gene_type:complete